MKYVHFVKFAQAIILENAQILAEYSPEVSAQEFNETKSVVDDMCTAIKTAGNYVKDEETLNALAINTGLYDYVEAYADSDEFAELHELALLYCK